jgi:hypothetical protein
VRLKAEICPLHPGLEAVEIPYRNEASHLGEAVGLPDAEFGFEFEVNTFAINDDGVVVGTFGLPFDPCSPPTGYSGVSQIRRGCRTPESENPAVACMPCNAVQSVT